MPYMTLSLRDLNSLFAIISRVSSSKDASIWFLLSDNIHFNVENILSTDTWVPGTARTILANGAKIEFVFAQYCKTFVPRGSVLTASKLFKQLEISHICICSPLDTLISLTAYALFLDFFFMYDASPHRFL